MIKIPFLALGAVAATMLAACATTARTPPPAASAAAQSQPSPSATPSGSPGQASERALANWLAAESFDPSPALSVVSGPVMQDYIEFEAQLVQADAAAGTPIAADTLGAIPSGYQLCGTNGSGGTKCDSLTGFALDSAGRVTGLAVDGQPIAGRIAAGRPDHGSQLAISDVYAYRPGGYGEVIIVFTVRNTGTAATDWLPSFTPSGGGQLQEDYSNSLPGSSGLQPGQSAVQAVTFATRAVAGQFVLRVNDAPQVLAGTVLSRP